MMLSPFVEICSCCVLFQCPLNWSRTIRGTSFEPLTYATQQITLEQTRILCVNTLVIISKPTLLHFNLTIGRSLGYFLEPEFLIELRLVKSKEV